MNPSKPITFKNNLNCKVFDYVYWTSPLRKIQSIAVITIERLQNTIRHIFRLVFAILVILFEPLSTNGQQSPS